MTRRIAMQIYTELQSYSGIGHVRQLADRRHRYLTTILDVVKMSLASLDIDQQIRECPKFTECHF